MFSHCCSNVRWLHGECQDHHSCQMKDPTMTKEMGYSDFYPVIHHEHYHKILFSSEIYLGWHTLINRLLQFLFPLWNCKGPKVIYLQWGYMVLITQSHSMHRYMLELCGIHMTWRMLDYTEEWLLKAKSLHFWALLAFKTTKWNQSQKNYLNISHLINSVATSM